MSYNGRCFGGPYDGKDIASESQTIELVKYPSVKMSELDEQRRSNTEATKLGCYRWTSVFIWEPAELPAADVPLASAETDTEEDQA